MRPDGLALVAATLAAGAAASCTAFNRIDACDAPARTDFQVNTRTEDDQFPTANGGLAALSSGLLAAVWNSSSATDVHQGAHVMAALMRPDGSLVRPCAVTTVLETMVDDPSASEVVSHAVIAAGSQPNAPVFVAWQARPAASDDDTGPFAVRARILSADLCPVSEVFTLSEPSDTLAILPRVAVRARGDDALVLFFAATTGLQYAIRARRLGMDSGLIDGAVENACDGAAGPCVLDQGSALSDPAVAPLGSGYVVGWFSTRGDGQAGWQLRTHVLDGVGAPADPPGWVALGDAILPDAETANLAIAPTAQPPGFALAWAGHNDDGHPVGEGSIFVERRAPDGTLSMPAVRANSPSAGVRYLPTLVEMAGGALAVAWTDERSNGRNIRATVLQGPTPLFNGVACDAVDFAFPAQTAGSRSVASLALGAGGVLFGIFDDDSHVGTDAFGQAVRGQAYVGDALAPALANASPR